MIFSSLIFLFWFLPLAMGLVFATPKRYRNTTLLIVSLVFYSWGEPKFILLMLFSILMNYLLGRGIGGSRRKMYLIVALIGNLGLLAFFKYAVFFIENINFLFDQPVIFVGEIYLPIGISFFTFQALSYVIDVYRKEVPAQKSLVKLALYISLFPQLIAGPIVRYNDINHQLDERLISIDKFALGVERFMRGLIKKVLIADNLAVIADNVFDLTPDQLDMPQAWMGIIAYTFQIYFDFSGYSDMAIGLGKMFGFDFMENFNYPYISKSIREFWRRWHISLSTWFRDYVYIPLGGNHKSRQRTHLNLILVFLLTGLWHGANWNFIVWGLYHGLFLIIERIPIIKRIRIPSLLAHLYTLFIVIIGWVFFRSQNLKASINFLNEMFSFHMSDDFPNNIRFLVSKEIMYVFILAIVFSIPTSKYILKLVSRKRRDILGLYYLMLVLFFVFSLTYIVADTYNPFIYFRF